MVGGLLFQGAPPRLDPRRHFVDILFADTVESKTDTFLAILAPWPSTIKRTCDAVAPSTMIGELHYVENGQSIIAWGILVPPVSAVIAKASPFGIGFPDLSLFFHPDILSLAFVAYIILFGDTITGIAVLKSAMPARPDEQIDYDSNRTQLSTGIRNALMGLVAPFFPTQGVLWTGVHVVIVNRWAEGRNRMESLHSGIASYYLFGIPFLYLLLPVVTALRPLMPIALALTLVLTGFACAYVAMSMVRSNPERGVILLGGTALALFNPWVGLLIAALATVTLLGFREEREQQS